MPATSVDLLIANSLNAAHIRKGKKVGVFWAPMATAIPAAFTAGGVSSAPVTLADLTGFKPVGLLRKDDGIAMSRNRETSTVEAIGFNDPVREDVTSDRFTAQITALETNRLVIEQYLGVDLTGVTPDTNTGEVRFPQPADAELVRGRWLFMAQDGAGADRYWWGRLFPAGTVTETDDQNMAEADGSWTWPMTISSNADTTAGYGVLHFFGGGGWKSRLTSLGFAP